MSKEITLTDIEMEALYKLFKERKGSAHIKIRVGHSSGIGQDTQVIVDGKEVDITDVSCW